MMTVRPELHLKFAEENEMSSFLLSAKSGDQIKQAFFKIAALLAGLLHCYTVTPLHYYSMYWMLFNFLNYCHLPIYSLLFLISILMHKFFLFCYSLFFFFLLFFSFIFVYSYSFLFISLLISPFTSTIS